MSKLDTLLRLDKHNWISQRCAGLSFADVGGLWGTKNETVSIASLSGAVSPAMIDIQPMDSKWWQAFHRRCKEYGVSDYQTLQLDICNIEEVRKSAMYDFVHCSGIIYHVSDPLQLIQNLKRISNKYVLISSMVIPEVIKGSIETIHSPIGTCHLIHTLPESRRNIFKEFFLKKNRNPDVVGIKTPDELFRNDGRVKTGPWWWLYTPETLEAMCDLCGLAVIESHTISQVSHSILCQIRE